MPERGRLGWVAVAAVAAVALVAGAHGLLAGEEHGRKAARLAELLGYQDRFREMLRRQYERDPGGSAAEIDAMVAKAQIAPLMELAAEEIRRGVDEAALDELLPWLETKEGRRVLVLMRAQGSLAALDLVVMLGSGDRRALESLSKKMEEAVERATGSVPVAVLARNETAAIATLRNLTSCQAQVQASGRIDVDRDGIGEYGTFLELSGGAGVRAGYEGNGAKLPVSTFAKRGSPIAPAIMSPAFMNVDGNGIVTRNGYCFRVYLPDGSSPAGFTHERGPAAAVGLAGGTESVAIDLSEVTWCAYAWPEDMGRTGRRAFFVNQAGDVLQSANGTSLWSGPAKAPPGGSAFLPGSGITGRVAVGSVGGDGEVWKVTN